MSQGRTTLDELFMPTTCRGCGCWDYDACFDTEDGPCWWVDEDLCSACHAIALLQAHAVAHDLGWPHAPWPREPNDHGHGHGHAYIPDRLRGVIADRPPEARPFA